MPRARARARSVCAEMHSGFGALRSHFPMNIEARLPEIGRKVLAEQAAVRDDLARIVQMWGELLERTWRATAVRRLQHRRCLLRAGGDAPDDLRVPVPETIADYIARVQALPGVAAWVKDALAEQDFLDFEEPYRQHR